MDWGKSGQPIKQLICLEDNRFQKLTEAPRGDEIFQAVVSVRASPQGVNLAIATNIQAKREVFRLL
jgi:hypothetical protein